MKRDMDLIRKLVLLLEERPSAWTPDPIEIEGYTPVEIGYHSYLLVESGLANGTNITTMGNDLPEYSPTYLTPAGHDFADSIRTQYIWDEVKEDIKAKGLGSATLDIVKKLVDKKIKKHLELD
jgi:hypothetical protein